MKTTTIYRINETDRTIDIAQSVQNDDESIHGAVLNTRTFTFDELMNQHEVFREHTELFNTFQDRLHSALRIVRSIEVNTEDMIARFIAEYGENIFFRGFVSAVIDLYDSERQQILKPNDVLLAQLNKNKIQSGISKRINDFFDIQLKLICSEAYFSYTANMEHFDLLPGRTIIAADNYTFNVFRESDNCLLSVLAEIGQLVHRNKWTRCECGFCHKVFLDVESEVCCHSDTCKNAQKAQKEAIFREHTEEYSQIKRTYDSFVRRYKSYLKAVDIDTRYPADYDEFVQAKEQCKKDMDNLKKRLIRNGLPAKELFDLGEQYKSEMKFLAEEILEKYGYNPTEVAKIKKPKKNGV